jgi:hypothetical protein
MPARNVILKGINILDEPVCDLILSKLESYQGAYPLSVADRWRFMDRITTALLNDFSKEHEIANLDEAKRFEHFAAFLAVSRHYAETFDTADVVVGNGDAGLDAIGIIVNGTVVTEVDTIEELAKHNNYLDVTFVFVQAERSASFDGSRIGTFGFGVTDFFNPTPKLKRNDDVQAAAEIMSAIYDRSAKFTRGNPVCRLYYVTTGKWVGDTNLEARRQAAIGDLRGLGIFRDIDLVPVDAEHIHRLYLQTKNAIQREFTFADRTTVPDIEGVTEAYIGLLPASQFVSILRDDDGEITKSIFYDNVRDWQDYNPVNTEIRDTLLAPGKARFALMNNGITIIAKSLQTTGDKFKMEDFQIVNGCQTSHVLFDQKDKIDDTVKIPLRLICTQDETIIKNIIRATNRQTEVKVEQFLAADDFQKKLEEYFKTFSNGKRLYYERRSRQYADQSIEKTRIVTPSNLIKAYAAMFLEQPHRTTRNYAALRESVGREIFAPKERPEAYYLSAFAAYRLEFYFRNGKLEPKYKPARYQFLLAVRLAASSERPPKSSENSIEKYCDPILETLWDADKAEELFAKAKETVEAAAKQSPQGKFSDIVRTEPFTTKVKSLLAN